MKRRLRSSAHYLSDTMADSGESTQNFCRLRLPLYCQDTGRAQKAQAPISSGLLHRRELISMTLNTSNPLICSKSHRQSIRHRSRSASSSATMVRVISRSEIRVYYREWIGCNTAGTAPVARIPFTWSVAIRAGRLCVTYAAAGTTEPASLCSAIIQHDISTSTMSSLEAAAGIAVVPVCKSSSPSIATAPNRGQTLPITTR